MPIDPNKIRALALAILNSGCTLTRKSGQYLGQLVAEPLNLSPAQREWLDKLAERAGFEPIGGA